VEHILITTTITISHTTTLLAAEATAIQQPHSITLAGRPWYPMFSRRISNTHHPHHLVHKHILLMVARRANSGERVSRNSLAFRSPRWGSLFLTIWYRLFFLWGKGRRRLPREKKIRQTSILFSIVRFARGVGRRRAGKYKCYLKGNGTQRWVRPIAVWNKAQLDGLSTVYKWGEVGQLGILFLHFSHFV